MPSFIKTPEDEELWSKAKEIVEKRYGKTEADGDHFWALVTGVYKKAGGNVGKALTILPLNRLTLVDLQKATSAKLPASKKASKSGTSKSPTGKQPTASKTAPKVDHKSIHKDLPPGGKWVTMHGHHVYIKGGKVLAGSVPGLDGSFKKATKAQLSKHQAAVTEGAGKSDAKGKKPSKPADAGRADGGSDSAGKPDATAKRSAKTAKASKPSGAEKGKVKTTTKAATVKGAKTTKQATNPEPTKLTTKGTPAAKKPKKDVADVRTEGQIGNELAYDVGQEVFGSRKDLAAMREELNKRIAKGQSVRTVLASLEKIDPGAAKKYCTKDNILPKFDWEAQHKQGVDLQTAMIKKLVLDRIQPKPDKDDPETRRQYAYAIEELHRVLAPVKTFDAMKGTIYALRDRMNLELPKHLNDQERYLEYAKKKLADGPSESDLKNVGYIRETNSYGPRPITKAQWKKEREQRIKDIEAKIAQWQENAKNPYHVLGEKLTNFFTDSDSANRTIDTVRKKDAKWEDYLNPEAKEQAPKQKRDQKARWERKFENPYFRSGGRKVAVQKPEDAVKQFGFRGVQFGHWVDDASGKFHLLKASEAFQDMADVLGMKDKDVSLNGRLAMAFGARGTGAKIAGGGAAAAHYEPYLRVINMTKEGGAGSLAHEWGHALDDILADHSGVMGYASENTDELKNPEVRKAYDELMDAIYNGDGTHQGTDTILNQKKVIGRYYPHLRRAVQERGLTPEVIKEHTDKVNASIDREKASLQSMIDMYKGRGYDVSKKEKQLKQIETKRKRELNSLYQELMYHHWRHTGNQVESIDIPVKGSEYFTRMQDEDGSSKPYYSTGREMFARVFESWMEHTLNAKGTKNHYLVAGTTERDVAAGAPFPKGSERKLIFEKMGNLMKTLVGSGEIKKALESDLQKALFNAEELREIGRDYEARLKAQQERRDPEGIESGETKRYAYEVPHTVDPSEVLYIPVNRLKMVYQTDDATDWDKVNENRLRMRNGQALEPVTIGYDYDVHDGHHRWIAADKEGHTHVPCVIGGTDELRKQAAMEKYRELWKSHLPDDRKYISPSEGARYIYEAETTPAEAWNHIERRVDWDSGEAPEFVSWLKKLAGDKWRDFMCNGAVEYIKRNTDGWNPLEKSVITDPVNGADPFGSDPNIMYRGIGQKELDSINRTGFVQTKGKGNDDDKEKRTTCFTNLFGQALGYAQLQFSQYGEEAAYVIALPKPPWVYEDEHGELLSEQPVPFGVGVVIPVPNPDAERETVFADGEVL